MPGTPLSLLEQAVERIAQLQHVLRGPGPVRIVGKTGDLLGAHAGAGGDHQEVVIELTRLGLDPAGVAVNSGCASLDQLDPLALRRALERNPQLGGIKPERNVNRVRLEVEVVEVGDQGDRRLVTNHLAEAEGGLKPAKAAPEDEDLRLGVTGHVDQLATATGLASDFAGWPAGIVCRAGCPALPHCPMCERRRGGHKALGSADGKRGARLRRLLCATTGSAGVAAAKDPEQKRRREILGLFRVPVPRGRGSAGRDRLTGLSDPSPAVGIATESAGAVL